MNMDDYQRRAAETAIYPGQDSSLGLIYAALKGAGEAGEFAEKVGKAIRDDGFMVSQSHLTEERTFALVKELGDELWYVAMKARELGYDLSSVAELNLQNLQGRASRGTLQGSGDDR